MESSKITFEGGMSDTDIIKFECENETKKIILKPNLMTKNVFS
jgi:hypothetical protein